VDDRSIVDDGVIVDDRGTTDVTDIAGLGPVVVAVLTYKRPKDLAELLPVLTAQVAALPGEVEVLVVDNDPAAGAEGLVADLALPATRYVHEPRPGIAAARNRALTEAAHAAALVFIDDDERPSDRWLVSMLEMFAAERCAAVVGPVVSEYEVQPEPWITEGRFFDRRRLATGTAVRAAATNNLLLDMRVVRELGLQFDEKFGLTGGSDTLFTRRLGENGRRMLWCDEALVVDVVPAHRLTRRWVLQKAFRSGNSWSRTSLELAGSAAERLGLRVALTARALPRLAGGAARLLAGVVTRRIGWRARGLRTIARGAGMASGALGYVYTEYRRPAAG
jgi:hypothetical protein